MNLQDIGTVIMGLGALIFIGIIEHALWQMVFDPVLPEVLHHLAAGGFIFILGWIIYALFKEGT